MLTYRTPLLRAAADTENGGSGATSAPAGCTAGSGVLDSESLARLRELDPSGSARLLERIVDAFNASTARLLPQMRQAGIDGNLHDLRYTSHTLKSSSASLGALGLSQLCADLEAEARAGEVPGAPAQVEMIAAEIAVVLQALSIMMDSAE